MTKNETTEWKGCISVTLRHKAFLQHAKELLSLKVEIDFYIARTLQQRCPPLSQIVTAMRFKVDRPSHS